MTQFKAFEEGIEVNGQTIMSVMAGLGVYKSLASRCLRTAGLEDVVADDQHWYPQQAWLDAFRIIADELGDAVLFQIGLKIPESAVFPKEIDDVEKALGAIDVAYHMNHRNRRREVLFDPTRPPARVMLEGIGHYKCEINGGRSAVMVCANPYPCAFDRGIIHAMATRFARTAQARHVDGEECRKKGGESCTYTVSW